jgi:O-antigen/teichoic acid export membrane protein
MGAAMYGQWSLILAAAAWIVVLRTAVGSDLIRKSAQDSQYASIVFGPAIVVLIIGGMMLGGIGILINLTIIQTKSILTPSVLTASAFVVIAVSAIPVSLFTGRDRMEWQLGDSVNSLLLLAGLFIMFGDGITISAVANVYLVTSLMVTVPLVLAGIWLIKPVSLGWTKSLFRRSLSDVGQLFVANWLLTLHWTLDLYLLQILLSSKDVGIYNAAFKLVVVFRILPLVIMMSVVPEITRRAIISDFAFIKELWITCNRILLSVAGLLVLTILVLADNIIQLVYSLEYERSTSVFMLLSISLFPLILQSITQSLLYAVGRYQHLNWGLTVGLLVQAIADYVLIVNFGLEGAAIAFFMGECVILACFAVFAIRIFGRPSLAIIGKILLCSLGAIVLSMIGLQYQIPSTLSLSCVITTYLLLLYFMGCISMHDIQLGKSLLVELIRGKA